jgi:glucosyl-dolichyl phosphate glucuronosyltransferase
MEISVIIPTYNRSALLELTLESLKALTYPLNNYEIILVDNGSTDQTHEIIKAFMSDHANAKYVYEQNPGLHSARHAGAKAAQGEILLYIDDDVIAHKDLLQEIIKLYDNKDVGCVGGKILPRWEEKPPDWIHKMPKSYLSILDDGDQVKEIKWIYGCNFSIRKKLLFELGGFNPDSFGDPKMWWYRGDGEIGLLRKVRGAGYKILYNPKAIVNHFIPNSRITLEYIRERAFKDGIEASFVHHRYSRSNRNNILSGFYLCAFVSLWVGCIFLRSFSLKLDLRSNYLKARCIYELKIITDRNLLNFVKTENWLIC